MGHLSYLKIKFNFYANICNSSTTNSFQKLNYQKNLKKQPRLITFKRGLWIDNNPKSPSEWRNKINQ